MAGHSEAVIACRTERRKGGEGDIFLLAIAEQFGLHEKRMRLHLQHGGTDFCVRQQVAKKAGPKITDANLFHQSIINQFLHRSPCFLNRNFDFDHVRLFSRGIEEPARRIAMLKWDEFLSDRKMDQIQIQLFQTQITQTLFTGRLHVFCSVIGVP